MKNRGWGVHTATWEWGDGDPKSRGVRNRDLKACLKELENEKRIRDSVVKDNELWEGHRLLKMMGQINHPKKESPQVGEDKPAGVPQMGVEEEDPRDSSQFTKEALSGSPDHQQKHEEAEEIQ